MELVERPEPVLREPHDVLLRVESVGVCGSDVHYYLDGRIGSQVVRYPFMVGHECSATVLEVGSAVRRVRPGDRVAVEPAVSCGACDQCRAGRRHTCRRLRFLGCPGQMEGCLCERLTMPEECCYALPPELSFDQAALVEPLSIGLYAVRLAGMRRGRPFAVLGAGPIGLCVLIAARAAGAGPAYVTEPIPERRAAAMSLGAAWAGDPYAADPVPTIEAREPLLLDTVFECSGKQEAMDEGVRLLAPGGRLMLIGIPAFDRASFEMDLLRRREIRLQNVRRQNECVADAIALAAERADALDRLRTHTFPLARAPEAMEWVANYRDGIIKAIIRVQDE
jgi:L-iditol 2-dehydrogenase